jgi:uncharacterized membrane protein (DUF106 family)
MIRALLLLVGWTPIATTGITINVLSRLKIVPQAIIDAWWSTGMPTFNSLYIMLIIVPSYAISTFIRPILSSHACTVSCTCSTVGR